MTVNVKNADRIANGLSKSSYAKQLAADWEYLRDCLDDLDYDAFQMDMFTDMVMTRLKKLIGE